MTIYSDIVTALSAVAGGRVYPADDVPEGTGAAQSYVVFRNLAMEPLMTLQGYGGMTRSTFAFECWAPKKAAAIQLASDVRAAIDAASAVPLKYREPCAPDEYQPLSDQFMELVQYSFWHA